MQSPVGGCDYTGSFSIPLPVTLTAVAGSAVFALAVSTAVLGSEPLETPWLAVSALLVVVTGLLCAGLAHAIGTRRTFRGCSLLLEAPLRLDEEVGFTLADPHRRLRSAGPLEITLAWHEKATRVGGRRTYIEGPYALGAEVSWEDREVLPHTGGPGIRGSFRVAGSEIRLGRLPEWRQRVEILLRVRTGRWRSCMFVLPLEGTR